MSSAASTLAYHLEQGRDGPRRRRPAPPIWDATQNRGSTIHRAGVVKDGVRFVSAASRSKTSGTWAGRPARECRVWPGMAMTADGTRRDHHVQQPSQQVHAHPHAIGRIYVYEYRPPPDDEWVQVGQVIEGKNNGDRYGESIQIGDDGSTIAFGAGRTAGARVHLQHRDGACVRLRQRRARAARRRPSGTTRATTRRRTLA